MSDDENDLADNKSTGNQVSDAKKSIKDTDDNEVDKPKEKQDVTDVSPEPPPINIGPPDSPLTW